MSTNPNHSKESVSKHPNIHYTNSIGAIIDNCLLVHTHQQAPIDINTINKAQIFKTNNLRYNFLFMFCTIPLGWTLFKYRFTLLEIIFISGLIAFLLACSFFFKNSKYVLFIRTEDLEFMEFQVDRSHKDDAKKIVRAVNRKIKQIKYMRGQSQVLS